MPWKLKFNQAGQFSVRDLSFKYSHLVDVRLNTEPDLLQA